MTTEQIDSRQAGSHGWVVTPNVRRARLTGGYSRFVAFMRWLLPIGAVALAAALIAWPYIESRDEGFTLMMSDLEVDDAGRLVMDNARFLGTDDKGQPYTVTAIAAWQDPNEDEIINLETLQGDITLQSGAWIAISAATGRYDRPAERLILEHDVSVFTDEGYELHTDVAEFDLSQGTGWGDKPVSGQGPAGLLEAQGFRLSEGDGKIHFVGPVHMTLFPGSAE